MTAAQKRTRTTRGRARTNAPRDFWHRKGRGYTLARDRFRVTCLRGPAKPALRLEEITDSLSWSDQSAVLKGEVAFRRVRGPIDVGEGHRIRLEVSHAGGAWRQLWTMRILEPSYTRAGRVTSAQLADDLTYLQLSKDDFVYHADKKHPHGWPPHEVVRDICRRYGVVVARLPKTKHRIKKMTKRGVSPLDAIVYALKKEKIASGQRMTISLRGGKLHVEPLKRSRELLEMGPTLIDASYKRVVLKEGFGTVLRVTGTGKKGKHGKKHKLTLTIRSPGAVRRYGYVHQIFHAADADTQAEMRRAAKRQLAKIAKPTEELTLTHYGIPTLRRGAALRIALPDVGLRQVVYVTGINHRLDSSGYMMDVTVRFDDPFKDKISSDKAQRRCEKARKRGKKSSECARAPSRRRSHPQPKKAHVRRSRA